MSIMQLDQARMLHRQRTQLRKIGYSDRAIELIQYPRNWRPLDNPTLCITTESNCGDTLILYALIRHGCFEEITFQYIGCVGLLSAVSALTILLQGKSLVNAYSITEQDIIHYLRHVPDSKYDCVQLAVSTLRELLDSCPQE